MDSNEKFKLTTRWYIAWGAMFIGLGTCAFIAIWQMLFGSGWGDGYARTRSTYRGNRFNYRLLLFEEGQRGVNTNG